LRPEVRPEPYAARRAVVASLPGADDRIGRSIVAGLAQLSRTLDWRADGGRWQCVVSPGILGSRGPLPDTVGLDPVPDPWDVLGRVRAVAVLTDLGYGFKTTVVDALAAGCHVLVTPRLARKLPPIVREHCIVTSPSDPESVRRAGIAVTSPPTGVLVNEALRLHAVETARRLFGAA